MKSKITTTELKGDFSLFVKSFGSLLSIPNVFYEKHVKQLQRHDDLIAEIRKATNDEVNRFDITEFCKTTRYTLEDVAYFSAEWGEMPTVEELDYISVYGEYNFRQIRKVKGKEYFINR